MNVFIDMKEEARVCFHASQRITKWDLRTIGFNPSVFRTECQVPPFLFSSLESNQLRSPISVFVLL